MFEVVFDYGEHDEHTSLSEEPSLWPRRNHPFSTTTLSGCPCDDFPSEWSAFVNAKAPASTFAVTIRKDYFPYFAPGKTIKIIGIDFLRSYSRLKLLALQHITLRF